MAQTGRCQMDDGCSIYFEHLPKPAAPYLVFANSLGTDLSMWDRQVTALRETFAIMRFDTRGHGQSDAPAGAYSIDRLSRDVLQLLDAHSIEQAYFCGLSLGGIIGQLLAIRSPERFAGFILSTTAAYMGPPKGWQDRIETVQRNGMAAISEAVMARFFSLAYRIREAAQVAKFKAMLESQNPVGYAGCCAAIRDMDLRPLAHLQTIRTLVIVGRDDEATPPELGHFIASSGSEASLIELAAGHLANVEAENEFTQAIKQFVIRD